MAFNFSTNSSNNNSNIPVNPLRYNHISNNLWNFKHGIPEDEFDEPGAFYFKIFFYFGRGNDNGRIQNGLLGCNFTEVDNIIENKKYKVDHASSKIEAPMNANSAYYYLRLNAEEERAEKLKSFIYLLSDISTNKPWYFQSIDGLATAMERKMYVDGTVKLEDKRKSITIKCLEDSYDMRIGTLLDLYKDIAFSYIQKKEILPANMRKFDMGIYIFNRPVRQLMSDDMKLGTKNYLQTYSFNKAPEDGPYDNGTSAKLSVDIDTLRMPQDKENYYTSCKYIELQNCEIGYNSGATGFGAVANNEPFKTEYAITIECDDIYEARYNEFMMRTIGDFVERDMYKDVYQPRSNSNSSIIDNIKRGTIGKNPVYEERYFKENNGILLNAIDEVIGAASSDVRREISHITMGNLGEYGLGGLMGLAGDIRQGDIFGAVGNVKGLIGSLKGDSQQPALSSTTISSENISGEDAKITNESIGKASSPNKRLVPYQLDDTVHRAPMLSNNSYLSEDHYNPEEIARLRALNSARNLANSI